MGRVSWRTGLSVSLGPTLWRSVNHAIGVKLGTAIAIVTLVLQLAACTAGPSPPPPSRAGPPLVEPREVLSSGGILATRLVARATEVTVGGRSFTALTYNGEATGPTLRLRVGDRLALTFVNRLSESTNLHFHGAHVSPLGLADDAFRRIAPGETGQYVLSFDRVTPGTLWYHAHVHGSIERQIAGGLSGVIIVQPPTADTTAWQDTVDDRVFALKDFVIRGARATPGAPTSALRVVNDLVDPVMTLRPGQTELWRLANVGADSWYRLRLDGHSFLVVGEDGQPTWEAWPATELLLPPGKRFDVVVQAGEPGSYELRTLAYDQGARRYPADRLAVLEVRGDEVKPAPLPTVVGSADQDLSDDPVSATRSFTLTEDPATGTYSIDGKIFPHANPTPFATLAPYSVEQWTIRNPTDELHPFHLHTNYFQVVAVNGTPYGAHGLQDTVVVPAGGSVQIRPAFYDFSGTVLFHCHILSHSDGGMMGTVRVG